MDHLAISTSGRNPKIQVRTASGLNGTVRDADPEEARAALKMSKEQRNAFFNGRKDANGKAIDRGMIGIRGL